MFMTSQAPESQRESLPVEALEMLIKNILLILCGN